MSVAQSTLRLLLIAMTIHDAAKASVRFNDGSITSSNESFMIDDSPDTCAAFSQLSGSSTARYCQFRVDVPFEEQTEFNVTLQGTNLGCGRNLYLSPLSAVESSKWTGRWGKCSVLETTVSEDVEFCLFRCTCSEPCEEIQILRGLQLQDSSWTLCDIHFLLSGCEEAPKNRSGVYSVKVTSDEGVSSYPNVFCDMMTDGGGWTVILRREDGSVDFQRNWEDYKLGFGSLSGEFWAGNELIHRLTSDGRTYSVRFDLEAYEGDRIFVVYNNFSVGPESDNYRLHVSGYNESSTGGDSFSSNDNMMFSTSDRDNDRYDDYNCAIIRSPWWLKSCSRCYPAGRYGQYPTVPEFMGIVWYYNWGWAKFAKYATMMIRPN